MALHSLSPDASISANRRADAFRAQHVREKVFQAWLLCVVETYEVMCQVAGRHHHSGLRGAWAQWKVAYVSRTAEILAEAQYSLTLQLRTLRHWSSAMRCLQEHRLTLRALRSSRQTRLAQATLRAWRQQTQKARLERKQGAATPLLLLVNDGPHVFSGDGGPTTSRDTAEAETGTRNGPFSVDNAPEMKKHEEQDDHLPGFLNKQTFPHEVKMATTVRAEDSSATGGGSFRGRLRRSAEEVLLRWTTRSGSGRSTGATAVPKCPELLLKAGASRVDKDHSELQLGADTVTDANSMKAKAVREEGEEDSAGEEGDEAEVATSSSASTSSASTGKARGTGASQPLSQPHRQGQLPAEPMKPEKVSLSSSLERFSASPEVSASEAHQDHQPLHDQLSVLPLSEITPFLRSEELFELSQESCSREDRSRSFLKAAVRASVECLRAASSDDPSANTKLDDEKSDLQLHDVCGRDSFASLTSPKLPSERERVEELPENKMISTPALVSSAESPNSTTERERTERLRVVLASIESAHNVRESCLSAGPDGCTPLLHVGRLAALLEDSGCASSDRCFLESPSVGQLGGISISSSKNNAKRKNGDIHKMKNAASSMTFSLSNAEDLASEITKWRLNLSRRNEDDIFEQLRPAPNEETKRKPLNNVIFERGEEGEQGVEEQHGGAVVDEQITLTAQNHEVEVEKSTTTSTCSCINFERQMQSVLDTTRAHIVALREEREQGQAEAALQHVAHKKDQKQSSSDARLPQLLLLEITIDQQRQVFLRKVLRRWRTNTKTSRTGKQNRRQDEGGAAGVGLPHLTSSNVAVGALGSARFAFGAWRKLAIHHARGTTPRTRGADEQEEDSEPNPSALRRRTSSTRRSSTAACPRGPLSTTPAPARSSGSNYGQDEQALQRRLLVRLKRPSLSAALSLWHGVAVMRAARDRLVKVARLDRAARTRARCLCAWLHVAQRRAKLRQRGQWWQQRRVRCFRKSLFGVWVDRFERSLWLREKVFDCGQRRKARLLEAWQSAAGRERFVREALLSAAQVRGRKIAAGVFAAWVRRAFVRRAAQSADDSRRRRAARRCLFAWAREVRLRLQVEKKQANRDAKLVYRALWLWRKKARVWRGIDLASRERALLFSVRLLRSWRFYVKGSRRRKQKFFAELTRVLTAESGRTRQLGDNAEAWSTRKNRAALAKGLREWKLWWFRRLHGIAAPAESQGIAVGRRHAAGDGANAFSEEGKKVSSSSWSSSTTTTSSSSSSSSALLFGFSSTCWKNSAKPPPSSSSSSSSRSGAYKARVQGNAFAVWRAPICSQNQRGARWLLRRIFERWRSRWRVKHRVLAALHLHRCAARYERLLRSSAFVHWRAAARSFAGAATDAGGPALSASRSRARLPETGFNFIDPARRSFADVLFEPYVSTANFPATCRAGSPALLDESCSFAPAAVGADSMSFTSEGFRVAPGRPRPYDYESTRRAAVVGSGTGEHEQAEKINIFTGSSCSRSGSSAPLLLQLQSQPDEVADDGINAHLHVVPPEPDPPEVEHEDNVVVTSPSGSVLASEFQSVFAARVRAEQETAFSLHVGCVRLQTHRAKAFLTRVFHAWGTLVAARREKIEAFLRKKKESERVKRSEKLEKHAKIVGWFRKRRRMLKERYFLHAWRDVFVRGYKRLVGQAAAFEREKVWGRLLRFYFSAVWKSGFVEHWKAVRRKGEKIQTRREAGLCSAVVAAWALAVVHEKQFRARCDAISQQTAASRRKRIFSLLRAYVADEKQARIAEQAAEEFRARKQAFRCFVGFRRAVDLAARCWTAEELLAERHRKLAKKCFAEGFATYVAWRRTAAAITTHLQKRRRERTLRAVVCGNWWRHREFRRLERDATLRRKEYWLRTFRAQTSYARRGRAMLQRWGERLQKQAFLSLARHRSASRLGKKRFFDAWQSLVEEQRVRARVALDFARAVAHAESLRRHHQLRCLRECLQAWRGDSLRLVAAKRLTIAVTRHALRAGFGTIYFRRHHVAASRLSAAVQSVCLRNAFRNFEERGKMRRLRANAAGRQRRDCFHEWRRVATAEATAARRLTALLQRAIYHVVFRCVRAVATYRNEAACAAARHHQDSSLRKAFADVWIPHYRLERYTRPCFAFWCRYTHYRERKRQIGLLLVFQRLRENVREAFQRRLRNEMADNLYGRRCARKCLLVWGSFSSVADVRQSSEVWNLGGGKGHTIQHPEHVQAQPERKVDDTLPGDDLRGPDKHLSAKTKASSEQVVELNSSSLRDSYFHDLLARSLDLESFSQAPAQRTIAGVPSRELQEDEVEIHRALSQKMLEEDEDSPRQAGSVKNRLRGGTGSSKGLLGLSASSVAESRGSVSSFLSVNDFAGPRKGGVGSFTVNATGRDAPPVLRTAEVLEHVVQQQQQEPHWVAAFPLIGAGNLEASHQRREELALDDDDDEDCELRSEQLVRLDKAASGSAASPIAERRQKISRAATGASAPSSDLELDSSLELSLTFCASTTTSKESLLRTQSAPLELVEEGSADIDQVREQEHEQQEGQLEEGALLSAKPDQKRQTDFFFLSPDADNDDEVCTDAEEQEDVFEEFALLRPDNHDKQDHVADEHDVVVRCEGGAPEPVCSNESGLRCEDEDDVMLVQAVAGGFPTTNSCEVDHDEEVALQPGELLARASVSSSTARSVCAPGPAPQTDGGTATTLPRATSSPQGSLSPRLAQSARRKRNKYYDFARKRKYYHTSSCDSIQEESEDEFTDEDEEQEDLTIAEGHQPRSSLKTTSRRSSPDSARGSPMDYESSRSPMLTRSSSAAATSVVASADRDSSAGTLSRNKQDPPARSSTFGNYNSSSTTATTKPPSARHKVRQRTPRPQSATESPLLSSRGSPPGDGSRDSLRYLLEAERKKTYLGLSPAGAARAAAADEAKLLCASSSSSWREQDAGIGIPRSTDGIKDPAENLHYDEDSVQMDCES